ncbi:MAG: hypothetical protein KGP14_17025, partial [Betaproteobacteria bacterium]|nr:hypothetical protein [Betaproteobacteria bacterium]
MIMTRTRPLHAWMRSRAPLRGSKGNTVVQPPPQPAPTPAQDQALGAQTDILKQQLALAQQQQAYGNAIAPLQLMQSGYTPQEVGADYQAKQGETVIPIGGKNYMISQDPNAKALADVN